MREQDSCVFVGNEKSGKSLFIFQLVCSLTTQHPFIDKYNVPKQSRVSYIQIEGELSDSQDRMKRMIKTLDFNPDYFHLKFSPPMELENRGYALGLRECIMKHWKANGCESGKPDVLIIDPVYFAFIGSLNDDKVVRQFIGNLRIIKDSLGCTLILVHHTHKQRWDYTGDKLDEGDEAIFGSKFLKAYPDHVLLFNYDKKEEVRILSCTTQRSGDIIKSCNLRLIEPDPLYFEEVDLKRTTSETYIVQLLNKPEFMEGLEAEQIMKQLDISRATFYNSIKKPLGQKVISKNNTRPVIYKIRHDKATSLLLHEEKII